MYVIFNLFIFCDGALESLRFINEWPMKTQNLFTFRKLQFWRHIAAKAFINTFSFFRNGEKIIENSFVNFFLGKKQKCSVLIK